MKLTIKDCIGIFNTIEVFKENDINFEIAWKLDDIAQGVKKHVERAQAENTKLVEKYGNIEGDKYSIKAENIETFNVELQKVLIVEVEVDIKPIPFDDLKGLKTNGSADISSFKKIVVLE